MRIRRLLATALFATGMVVTMPAVAHASGGGSGEIAECLVKAAEAYEENKDAGKFDEAAKECYSAPSPIVPVIGEIVWGGLAFAIVAFVPASATWPLRASSPPASSDMAFAPHAAAYRP